MKSKLLSKKLFLQIGKFAVVGIINTAIDLAVLNFLIIVTHRGHNGVYYSLFKAISFCFSTANSYLLHSYWTFAGSGRKRDATQASQFFGMSLIGWVINVVVSSMVVNYIMPSAGLYRWWPSIAALFGTALGLVWNFIAYKFVVFKKQRVELEPPV